MRLSARVGAPAAVRRRDATRSAVRPPGVARCEPRRSLATGAPIAQLDRASDYETPPGHVTRTRSRSLGLTNTPNSWGVVPLSPGGHRDPQLHRVSRSE